MTLKALPIRLRRLTYILVPAVSLAVVAPAHALISFGKVGRLDPVGSMTDVGVNDSPPSHTSVGSGVWVVAWSSTNSLGGTIGTDDDILFSRTTDNGETWSLPQALNTTAASDSSIDGLGGIAAGMSGVVIAIWRNSALGGTVYSRSVDGGTTWPAPVALGPSGTSYDLVTNGAGTWVATWQTTDTLGGTIGSDEDILYVRSTDNGATWSAPAPLNTDAATDTLGDEIPQLATDGAGTWVVAWRSGFVMTATSVDNGATWTDPVQASPSDPGAPLPVPDLATDGAGKWIAVWAGVDPGGMTETGPDGDIFFITSTDDGSTWTAPAAVNPAAATDVRNDVGPDIVTDGGGVWYVTWGTRDTLGGTIGDDADVLISRSVDGGITWTSAAAAHTSAAKDRKGNKPEDDGSFAPVFDGVENWILILQSTLAFEGDTSVDFDLLFATSRDDCPSTPSVSCRMPGTSKTAIRVLDRIGGRDLITWTWKGEETLLADFGDPLSTSDYTLCLYDHVSSSPVLVSEHDMPAGETCKNQPCWKAASSGLLYKDPRLEHGPIKMVKLVPGADGKAKIKVKAKGPTVAPPRLPLAVSPEVTAQLHNLETGECWSATYTSAITNDAAELKAKSN